MWKSAVLFFAASLAWSGQAMASSATFVWSAGAGGVTSGLGTSTVEVSSTAVATLTLDIVLDIDSLGPLIAGGADLEFDTDLLDELDILSFSEMTWTNAKATRELANLTPGIISSQESTGMAEGQVFGLEAFTLGNGPLSTTLTFARVVFTTNPGNVATDGGDIFATNERDLSIFFQTDDTISFTIPTGAAVNAAVPEPSTVLLIGLGVTALAAQGRRR